MEEDRKNEDAEKPSKSIGTMNLILIIVGVSLVAFTVKMISLFELYGTVPDTLITCVFTALAGECGIMGWIKTTKEKNKDRKWLLEDRKQEKEDIAAAQQTAIEQPVRGGGGNGAQRNE